MVLGNFIARIDLRALKYEIVIEYLRLFGEIRYE